MAIKDKLKSVRLTRKRLYPEHHAFIPINQKQFDKFRGIEIVVGKPHKPSKEEWPCGTKKIYPVIRQGQIVKSMKDEQTRYVCEHQIQLSTLKSI